MKVTETPNIQYAPYGYANQPTDYRLAIYVAAGVALIAVIVIALVIRKK